ncbi:MAG: YggS family pyridoxal phosphate-dependent enzyme [Oligoflexia bacterium]|nr:YggS family pyridoxal phosphate-dependent enzyme [Oligoflexia bacterium]
MAPLSDKQPLLATRFQQLLRHVGELHRQSAYAASPLTVLAVSKTHPIEAIEALYWLGQRDFAENYAQELVEKAKTLEQKGCSGIRWHFIGHLQTNKVKALIPFVHSVHAVDSEKLARELATRWKASSRPGRLPVFLEVNIDRETSKSGLDPDRVPAVAARISELPELELQGLMCIPSAEGSAEDNRAAFGRLRELEIQCRPHTQGKLSMGMSGDYTAAIQEGTTHIRIGTALFGPRPAKTRP